MSATEHACLTFRCDGCGATAEHDEGFTPHFDSRASAVADGVFEDWDMPADADGPDLCPECVCTRAGHTPDAPLQLDGGRVLHFCQRCGRSIGAPDPQPAGELS